MHPLVPILACYAMGLALLFARGGGRDPLLAAALAMPVGAAATGLLAYAVSRAGAPLSPVALGAAWIALFALAGWAARGELRRLWPGPAALGAVFAAIALVAARFDVVVLDGRSHDALLVAALRAAGGDAAGAPAAGGLASSLHAAFLLVSPAHVAALVPVLAASGLFALAVLVARASDHPRRVALAAASAAALASSFAVVRSLLTVGSPALAGVMLLAGGGLWYACERWRDPRPLPVALGALAAFALQGAPYALGALLFAAAMAAGTRLSSATLVPGYRAAAPGLRFLVATVVAGLAVALGAGPAAAVLALAPLLLLAAVALAAGRDRALELDPGEPIVMRSDLRILAVAWVAGVVLVASLEWALLNLQVGDSFAGTGQRLRLLPLAAGNLLPYGLAASLIVMAAELASRLVAGRLRWHRLAVATAGALVAAPYAIWLARYTFSGPQAHAMRFRPMLVVLAAVLLAASLGAALWFAALRRERRGRRPLVIAGLLLFVATALVASRAGPENEYPPLHQFLGLSSLLVGALAGREIADLVEPAGRRLRLAPVIAVGAFAWSAGAGVILARAHADAWLVWSDTAASRYLTRRWSFLTPAPDLAAIRATMIVKPDLESTRSRALRAQRAAAPPPDIVLFSIDGLRQDRVGAYGHHRRRLTPNIDRFAERGVRFTRAYSSFPATQVFNTALLLGRFVDRSTLAQQPPSYGEQAITNLLKRRDYHIFVKGWFEQSLSNRFDPRPYSFDTYAPKSRSRERLEEPMDEGLARLAVHLDEARQRGRPVFVWIHLLATHPIPGQGYRPHQDFDFGDSSMDRYESAVAGSDRWLGRIEELMTGRPGGGRPTVWVIFADHGVNAGTESRDLFERVVRVPFVVVAPGLTPGVDDRPIDASLDLAATVLDLAGIEPPTEYDGVSLAPLLAGLPAGAMAQRIIPLLYVEGATGAVHGRFKYVSHSDVLSLYDLEADPDERHNLIGEQFGRAHAMSAVAERELDRRIRDAERARGEGPW